MDILELVDNLEEVVENGTGIPLTGKCLVNREELFEIIQEIRIQLPEEFKQAKWIKEERQRILFDAQKEADNVLKNAEDKIVSLINEHEITKRAQDQGESIIEGAQKNAKDIRLGAKEYADSMLSDIEQMIGSIKDTIFKSMTNVGKQIDEIDGALEVIKENRISLKK